ncbi:MULTISPECIES: MAB_1171c family putative transporter [unclassified Nocardia]|uniref:MAB_1171c family putative transporter n=1 Tax=unclassified Nocardia TaxID=2637762 RepID=UPI001CE3D170|nr:MULTISPECIES: MAB_1171c family putative transporter [unclassified Nocardia]
MTSSLPAPIAWLIIGVTFALAVLRCALGLHARSRPTDRLVTYALLFAAGAGFLRERAAQQLLADLGLFSIRFTQQLSVAFIALTLAPLLLLAASWSELWSTRAAATTRVVWIAAYASGVLLMIVGAHARSLDAQVELIPGWQGPVFILVGFSGWAGVGGLLMVAMCIRELRQGDLRPTHRRTFLAIVILGIWVIEEAVTIWASSICAALEVADSFVEWRFRASQSGFLSVLGCATLVVAAGIATEIARRLGWDSAARTLRQLAPMWDSLVTACPEIPRPRQAAAGSSHQRLHRMTIEIRDALLVLGRYAEPPADDTDGPAADAIQIIRALRRKQSGAAPGQYQRLQASAPGRDIVDEIQALRRIAAYWNDPRIHAEAEPLMDGERTR